MPQLFSQVDGQQFTLTNSHAGLAQEPGHFLSSDHLRRHSQAEVGPFYFILCLRQDLCHNLELDSSPASDFMPHNAVFGWCSSAHPPSIEENHVMSVQQ